MPPLELVIFFRGTRKNLGLLELDCTVVKIKEAAVNITSPYGLDSTSKIMLNATNPENKMKVALDSEFALEFLCKIHQIVGVSTLTVEVVPVLHPQFQDSSLLQALLINLRVVLPDELITQLNESVDGNASVGGQTVVGRQAAVGEQVVVGADKSDEDAWLSDYSDRRADSDDDDVNMEFMETEFDDVVEPKPIVDEGSEDSGDHQRGESSELESDSDDNLSDSNKEVRRLVDSSDDDVELGTVQLTNYLQQHEYKVGADGKHRLKLGHVFRDVGHFREILHEVMVRKRFAIKTVYSEPRRFVGTCKEANCPWYVSGAKLNDGTGFILREYNKNHECRLTNKTVKVTSAWVASKIKGQVAVYPNVKIDILKNHVQETYGLKIGKLTLYRARAKARLEVFGDHSRGYKILFDYATAIHKADPGVICKVLCDAISIPNKVLFQRFFVAFLAQKNAYLNGCRLFIGVDGCHLKGKYSGVLLAAIGIDGNNGIVPLALCVCEIENTETWGWFMENLNNYLDDGRQSFAGAQLKQLFWKAAKSRNKHDFDEAMAEIKAKKEAAFEWLERELHSYNWSMHTYDRNCMVDRTDNNASECFNNWILAYRDRPCLTMLEEIRCRLMKRFTKRRNEAATWKKQLTPKVLKDLDKKNKIVQKMIVQASGDLNFQVMDRGYNPPRRFIVKLESRTCDCGYWEIAGLPCQHAMAAMGYARHQVQEYVPTCFSRQAYLSTYSVMFSPLPDQCTWEPTGRPLIEPPIVERKIGRPKKSRKRAANKPQKEKRKFFVICSFCGGSNHNVRSCPLRPSVARSNRARNNNFQASTTSNQPLNASQQARLRRKQAAAAKSIGSGQPAATASETARKIPSGPGQSLNAGTKKRRALRGAGTRQRQSSPGLNQSQNPSQASIITVMMCYGLWLYEEVYMSGRMRSQFVPCHALQSYVMIMVGYYKGR
ncbi:SWIM-type domain-containing protein [Citrus sinensis]|uniref:SWIM-type domain-containing protein n=1 Tax=Citrus sinensis TaxID=2711 RepID=A0ACB8K9P2_CITSI|nr:SWIM-type domain-containing protein [Citrus sinensis]